MDAEEDVEIESDGRGFMPHGETPDIEVALWNKKIGRSGLGANQPLLRTVATGESDYSPRNTNTSTTGTTTTYPS